MYDKLVDIIMNYVEVNREDIHPDSRFMEDLGFTSFDFMSMLGEIEDELDIEIEGQGFLQVMKEDGSLAYTRDGCLQVDSLGQLCTNDGLLIQPSVSIPRDATEVTITQDGNISVTLPGQTQQSIVGSLQLVKFQNPSGLLSIGHNLYKETQASGNPVQDTPGQNGLGLIQQGMLEGSNVQIVDELVGLIKAERAFESNSKLINSSSNILQLTNNMS